MSVPIFSKCSLPVHQYTNISRYHQIFFQTICSFVFVESSWLRCSKAASQYLVLVEFDWRDWRCKAALQIQNPQKYQYKCIHKYPKGNEKRISSIGHTSYEKNPKNHPKCHFSEKQCFRVVFGIFLITGMSD